MSALQPWRVRSSPDIAPVRLRQTLPTRTRGTALNTSPLFQNLQRDCRCQSHHYAVERLAAVPEQIADRSITMPLKSPLTSRAFSGALLLVRSLHLALPLGWSLARL